MQGYSYSVFSLAAIAIHLIFNFQMLIGKGNFSTRGMRYRGFLLGTLIYYIADAAWGIFAGLGWTGTLYVETVFFFLSLAVFVFMWSRFVITYLGFTKWPAWVLSGVGYALILFNLVALAANPFNKCLYYIDAHGVYRTGVLRDPAFCFLVAYITLIAVFACARGLSGRDLVRRRSRMVFLFSITIALANVLQIIWPLTPFTALGCLVGNCFLHVFVVADEQTAKHMAELEKALERARVAERARSMFFSTVSHDIRTPLNAIIGYTELLIDGIPDEQERAKALSGISTSGQTLLQLINDVLDLSKLESGKMVINPKPTDVRELVSSVVRSVDVTIKDRDVELKEEYGDLPILEIDPQRIRQILFNLVGNAVKFTEHGEIRISASFRKNSDDGKGNFTLSVSDTGCGIADEDKDKVMDPFVQLGDNAKIKGTGLGLPICKKLAAGMGGQLSFVSELGKGSTFTVELYDVKSLERLPDADGAPAAGQKPAGETGKGTMKVAKQYHLLIADDVPLNLSVLNALLKKIGLNDVETAADGQEALEKIRTSKRPFDCVLTDIWMPKLNGRELIAEIRADKRFAKLPVYAVTADVEEQKAFSERGFTGVLLKPLTIDKLAGLFR